jgi:hypothetical protein
VPPISIELAVEVDGDDRVRPAAVAGGVGPEGRAVDDGEVRHETVQRRAVGRKQQMPDEQPVPGQFRHQPHVDPQRRIGAGIQVLHMHGPPFR